VLPFVGHIVEATVPWGFLLVLHATQGPTYALGSWVPPLLVGVLIISATARLRPLAPLVLGTSGGIVFITLYWLLLKAGVPADADPAILYGTTMQVSRACSLAFGGLIASIVTFRLRELIGRAERAVREQELFGKYRLEAKIAAGGMGVVHRAVYCPEGGFERVVAVKMLHTELAEQAPFLAAFRNEAELSARLVHPNIVQVLDFGRAGDAYFMAMEFVDGMTLGELARRAEGGQRVLSPALVAWIGHEILGGLQHSHAGARDGEGRLLRVVHRDLCPANVLVSRSGQVKIADFGISRALRDANVSVTRTVAGHLGYMAPEHARGEPIDERIDLFAVGVILWELLALRRLFHRGAEAATLLALMSGEVPDIRSLRPDLDPAWGALIERAVAPDPARRFESARAMLSAIAALPGAHGNDLAEELAELMVWADGQAPPRADRAAGGTLALSSSYGDEVETRQQPG